MCAYKQLYIRVDTLYSAESIRLTIRYQVWQNSALIFAIAITTSAAATAISNNCDVCAAVVEAKSACSLQKQMSKCYLLFDCQTKPVPLRLHEIDKYNGS